MLSDNNPLEHLYKGKIYAGEKVFDKLSKVAASAEGVMWLNGVTIEKCVLLEPNQILSMDEDIIKVMKELEEGYEFKSRRLYTRL